MDIFEAIRSEVIQAVKQLYLADVDKKLIQVESTNPDFAGDITVVVFPLLRLSKSSPENTATRIGDHLLEKIDFIDNFNVVKGFLNFSISHNFWIRHIEQIVSNPESIVGHNPEKKKYLIEYSSPNTNKPLHLGHIRNNLIGHSISEILKARGHEVIKANLVNDRGIHICKSMLAWMKFGEGETPDSAGMKGDFLIGKYYVLFEKKYREEVALLTAKGISEKEAEQQSESLNEAKDLLLRWENNDLEVRRTWAKLNSWAYAGFDITYKRMGISFDKIYHESETYKKGKELVKEGLQKTVFFKKEDQSIWCSLVEDGMDEKLLIRADGTSVYMTQDLGTAQIKHDDFHPDISMYIVGNEQEYHFNVLKLLLSKLRKKYADSIYHLSYGMVELPQGKMKSREGKVVDADDLMDEMAETALNYIQESGKLENTAKDELTILSEQIGMGALKFFILKTDIRKNITFNPKESIDFQGFTGPFAQYTHARICSVLNKSGLTNTATLSISPELKLNEAELDILKKIYLFNKSLADAELSYDPSLVAQYVFHLAKLYNKFYHDNPILKNENIAVKNFRLMLSEATAIIIRQSLHLLGITAPEKM